MTLDASESFQAEGLKSFKRRGSGRERPMKSDEENDELPTTTVPKRGKEIPQATGASTRLPRQQHKKLRANGAKSAEIKVHTTEGTFSESLTPKP